MLWTKYACAQLSQTLLFGLWGSQRDVTKLHVQHYLRVSGHNVPSSGTMITRPKQFYITVIVSNKHQNEARLGVVSKSEERSIHAQVGQAYRPTQYGFPYFSGCRSWIRVVRPAVDQLTKT